MKTQHTLGPWTTYFDTTAAGTPFGIIVGGKSPNGLQDTVICHAPDYREDPISFRAFEKNANLIAAAPDLLAALRRLDKAYDESIEMPCFGTTNKELAKAWGAARAAIAKATGDEV